jgi:pimeloyl-ACP methyl ester carboxylesterase
MELRALPWLTPEPNESLNSYARRLSAPIDQHRPFLLLGLSFGGVVVAEMAQFLKPEKVILISTLENKKELPYLIRNLSLIGINPLLRIRKSAFSIAVMRWLFGVTKKENKRLLDSFIVEAKPVLLRWSLYQILRLDTQLPSQGSIRIHGSHDRLIPHRNKPHTHTVTNGGHFMVIENHEEVNTLICRLLK